MLAKKANVQGIGTFIYLLIAVIGCFVVYPMALPGYFK